MIKLIMYVVVLGIFFCVVSDAKIGFRPFSFSLQSWRFGIGWMLIVTGMYFIRTQGAKDGFKAGYGKARDQVVSIIQDEYKNQQKNQQ